MWQGVNFFSISESTKKNYCNMSEYSDYCESYKDCYYKQLKCLQAENEELKQKLEIDKNQINYFIEENEKQKEQIKQLEDFIKSDGEIDHINHEYTYKLKKENLHYLACMTEQRNKLKIALEEIRELINETCWDYTDISIILVKNKMLEVINEVLYEQ